MSVFQYLTNQLNWACSRKRGIQSYLSFALMPYSASCAHGLWNNFDFDNYSLALLFYSILCQAFSTNHLHIPIYMNQ